MVLDILNFQGDRGTKLPKGGLSISEGDCPSQRRTVDTSANETISYGVLFIPRCCCLSHSVVVYPTVLLFIPQCCCLSRGVVVYPMVLLFIPRCCCLSHSAFGSVIGIVLAVNDPDSDFNNIVAVSSVDEFFSSIAWMGSISTITGTIAGQITGFFADR